jgi:hypothetical protein
MKYLLACAQLEKVENAQAKISEIFNKSSRIRTWFKPTENTWVVQSVDATTRPMDLVDMVRIVSEDLRTVVTPFTASLYAGFFETPTIAKFNEWLKNNPEPAVSTDATIPSAPEPDKPGKLPLKL